MVRAVQCGTTFISGIYHHIGGGGWQNGRWEAPTQDLVQNRNSLQGWVKGGTKLKHPDDALWSHGFGFKGSGSGSSAECSQPGSKPFPLNGNISFWREKRGDSHTIQQAPEAGEVTGFRRPALRLYKQPQLLEGEDFLQAARDKAFRRNSPCWGGLFLNAAAFQVPLFLQGNPLNSVHQARLG